MEDEDEGEIDMRYFRIINSQDVKGFPFFLSTQLYSEWVFAKMKSTPAELGTQVAKILQSLHSLTSAAKSGKYMGWVAPRNYDSVRELMKSLKVGPYSRNSLRTK
jgi:hypothetical protein